MGALFVVLTVRAGALLKEKLCCSDYSDAIQAPRAASSGHKRQRENKKLRKVYLKTEWKDKIAKRSTHFNDLGQDGFVLMENLTSSRKASHFGRIASGM